MMHGTLFFGIIFHKFIDIYNHKYEAQKRKKISNMATDGNNKKKNIYIAKSGFHQ